MENARVAVIGIIVENPEKAEELNKILHEFRDCVVGRMGIPYRQKGINIITLVVDAPHDVISSLSGKIGMLKGISSKTVYSKVSGEGGKANENAD